MSDEARKGLQHRRAAGKDNLPSVLSGFTPVLWSHQNAEWQRDLIFIVGKGGKGGGEIICGRELGQYVALESYIQRRLS